MRSHSFGSIRLICITAIMLLSAIAANAQFKAVVQGSVTDSTGAIIPGATITLKNPATGYTETVTANSEGFYRFVGLPPGSYEITASQSGFKKQVAQNVVVQAETTTGYDMVMQTGEVTAEVVVNAGESATLQTETADTVRSISSKEVQELPQIGRDPYQLARLAPGVFGDGARAAAGGASRIGNNGTGPGGSNNGIFAVENQTQISANGQRVTSNGYTIDGVSVNSQTWGGAAVITPTQESVEEVVVSSSTYSAEDGRNSGALVKVISKSGSNQFHGSGFAKFNDPSFNAYNRFRGVNGVSGLTGLNPTRVNDKFKTYGGSFGGKIVSDKLFYFFSYEGSRNSTNGITGSTFVETPSYRAGLLGLRSGTVSAALLGSGADPRIAQTLQSSCSLLSSPYNLTTVPGGGYCQVVGTGLDIGSFYGTYGTYLSSTINTTTAPLVGNNASGGGLDGIADLQLVTLQSHSTFKGNQYQFRLDYQATQNDRITFSSYTTPINSSSYDTSAQSRPHADLNSNRLTYLIGGIWSHVFSGSTVNEFRFNFTKWGYDEVEANPQANMGLPRVEIEAVWGDRLRFGFARADTTPGVFDQRQMDFRDTLSKMVGNHGLKFGVEWRKELNRSASVGGARPLYSFTRMWNFANGTPVYEAINANANGVPSTNDVPFNTGNIGAFIQDNWKVRQNLTLNLGVRWEYFAPITTGDDKVLGRLELGPNGLIDSKIVSVKQFTDKDLNNFGPQIGFAWSPRAFKDKLVVRGGGGMGYDRLASALLGNARFAPPNAARYGICCGTDTNPFVGGQMIYAASTNGQIDGYPRHPLLGGGYAANGGPVNGQVEVYSSDKNMPSAYVMRYSLEFQYEMPGKLVGTLGYQGAQGRHFARILPLHLILPNVSTLNLRPVYYAVSDVNTSFNAMLVGLRRRFGNNFALNANYRWGKSIDNVSVEAPCACTNQTYPIDNSSERAPSDFDVTHYFNAFGTYETPWFKKPKNLAGDIFGNWSFSPIVTWRGGFPWTPVVGRSLGLGSTSLYTISPIRPVLYYGAAPASNTNSTFTTTGMFPGNYITGANCATGTGCSNYFLTTVTGNTYQANPPGIGRNVFRGPRYFSVDLSVVKSFPFPESSFLGSNARFDVRINAFNLLNTLNLAPFTAGSNSTRIDNVQFGYATAALAGRVGEIQLRFSF